jgi:hypothetical protein
MNVVRSILRGSQKVVAGFVSAFLIARIVGSILWLLCTIPFVQRLAEWHFHARLRRSGLDADAVDALTEEYACGISILGRRARSGASASG